MARKIVALTVILMFLAAMVGCESIPQEHRGAAAGAGIGAAAGTLGGIVFGQGAGAAVAGGLIGALVGGVIGHYAYDKQKTQEQTAKQYNYQPASGEMVSIEKASVSPATVAPGGKVDMNLTYAVLTPDPKAVVNVQEVREIRHNGALVGKPTVSVQREGGTYSSDVPLTLPADAKKGTYTVLTTVTINQASDSRESSFTVQ
jgi:hypothetical protein